MLFKSDSSKQQKDEEGDNDFKKVEDGEQWKKYFKDHNFVSLLLQLK